MRTHDIEIPLMPVHELNGIPDTFCNVFDRNKTVGVLKCNHVEGWDVKLFKESIGGDSTRKSKDKVEDSDLDFDMKSNIKKQKLNHFNNDEEGLLPTQPEIFRGSSKSFPDPQLSARDISQTLSLLPTEESNETTPSGARFVFPHDLQLREITSDGNTKVELCDSVGPLKQFVFECSTSEILNFDFTLLRHVVSCPHFNDLRTIFLAHDKRMLSVFSSPDIVRDYASPEDAAILRDHIIPTFICGIHTATVTQAKLERNKWLVKPNSGGKGVGIVFGRDCASDTEWVNFLDDPRHKQYILQEVVEQQHVNILSSKGELREMLVVGLLHCFNSKFFGT